MVDEYHRMGEVGLLNADAPVELIDGEILKMPPTGDANAAISNRLNLRRVFGDRRTRHRCRRWQSGPLEPA